MGWGKGKGSQGLYSCCEKATRDPGLKGAGFCGGAGYRCLRRIYTVWFQCFVFICCFFLVLFFLWVSVATFVAPTSVTPWYAFIFQVLLLLQTEYAGFHCLSNLRAQADEWTSKMRFASEGVDAIFNDEGQYLED